MNNWRISAGWFQSTKNTHFTLLVNVAPPFLVSNCFFCIASNRDNQKESGCNEYGKSSKKIAKLFSLLLCRFSTCSLFWLLFGPRAWRRSNQMMIFIFTIHPPPLSYNDISYQVNVLSAYNIYCNLLVFYSDTRYTSSQQFLKRSAFLLHNTEKPIYALGNMKHACTYNLIQRIGIRWQKNRLEISREFLISETIREKIIKMNWAYTID